MMVFSMIISDEMNVQPASGFTATRRVRIISKCKSRFPISTKNKFILIMHLRRVSVPPYLQSGPIPPTFLLHSLYPLTYLHSKIHPHHLLHTNCQPQFLPYLHSGPIPTNLMTQWAPYPLSYLHSRHLPRHLLYTNCPPVLLVFKFHITVVVHILFILLCQPKGYDFGYVCLSVCFFCLVS